jgi:hypothetical protein
MLVEITHWVDAIHRSNLLLADQLALRIDTVAVGTLPVPHLPPGVALVGQDRRHCGYHPRIAGTVPVAVRVGGG